LIEKRIITLQIEQKQIHVMQLIAALEFGGAERLAATISASLPKAQFKVSVCGFTGKEGPLVEDLRCNGIPHFFLDAQGIGKVTLLRSFYRLLRAQQVDIVQIHGAYILLNCFLPAKLAGVRIIYTEHAKQSISRHRLVNLAARFTPYWLDKVVCVSENLHTFFRDMLGVADTKLQVIHNGINVERFRMDTSPFSANKNKRVIGCIARLSEAKDHDNLLKAFATIETKRNAVKLLLVGEGEMREVIEQRIAELGLGASVELLGNRNDIPELLARMDIFVLPSKREGFPVSILEAMAAGRPVVATDVGGVSEVISSGKNGLVVPPENPDALADALLFLLDNPHKAIEMSALGAATVLEHFSVTGMMKKYVALFQGVSIGRL
jgi:glycosyltransferase involved in cell wall biosynthesis